MFNIAAVVILYNPESSIVKNISSYIDQVEKLYAIDNSEKLDNSLIEKIKRLHKVEYIPNKTNLGIAAALNIGANKAIEEGFDYLLTMDQDSEASATLVTTLLEGFSIDSKVALVSPIVYHRKGKRVQQKTEKSFEQVISNWTSGSLLDLHVFKTSGGFDEKLFIDYVDHEFCLRLNKMGFKIFLCNKSFLKHDLGRIEEINLIFRKVYPTNHSAVRLYYRARNRFYVKHIYEKYIPAFFERDNKDFWKSFIIPLKKSRNIFFINMDYKKNKFGKLNRS